MRAIALFVASVLMVSSTLGDKHGLDLPVQVEVGAEESAPLALLNAYSHIYEVDNVIWIIDTSGSMQKSGEWEIAKTEVRRSIRELPNGTWFGVVAFADGVMQYPNSGMVKLSQGTRKLASAWLEQRMSKNKSCLKDALLLGIKKFGSLGGRNVILYVGDGGANCPAGGVNYVEGEEEQKWKEILTDVSQGNRAGPKAIINMIGVLSPRPEAKRFMGLMASRNGGTYRQVFR